MDSWRVEDSSHKLLEPQQTDKPIMRFLIEAWKTPKQGLISRTLKLSKGPVFRSIQSCHKTCLSKSSFKKWPSQPVGRQIQLISTNCFQNSFKSFGWWPKTVHQTIHSKPPIEHRNSATFLGQKIIILINIKENAVLESNFVDYSLATEVNSVGIRWTITQIIWKAGEHARWTWWTWFEDPYCGKLYKNFFLRTS